MSELTRVPLTAAEVGALTRMQPYEDGKGGWLFRDPTTAERADVVERIIATRGRNANPYRAAPSHPTAEVDQ